MKKPIRKAVLPVAGMGTRLLPATLTAAHVKAILGDMADRPGAANNLLKALRVLLRQAIDTGLLHDNPDQNIRKLPVRRVSLVD